MNNENMIVSQEIKDYIQVANMITISKLFDALDVTPTPMQLNVIDLFDNKLQDWNFLTIVASRRSGKSFTAAFIILRELVIPNSSTIAVSTSAKSLSNLFNEVLRLLRTMNIPIKSINSQQYYIKLSNDSYFRAAFPKSVEGLAGNRASLIVLDEAGLYEYSEFLEQILLPMRLDYKSYPETKRFVSKVVMVSSPRGIGSDFYHSYNKGLHPITTRHLFPINDNFISPSGYVSMRYNIYDSPLLNEDMIEAIKESVTDDNKWKNEYLAEFTPATQGSVFKFDNNNIYNKKELLNKYKELGSAPLQGFMGVDIGIRDNSAIVVMTIIDRKAYVLDSYEKGMLTTQDLAKKIKELMKYWETEAPLKLDFSQGAIYCDPSALTTRHDLANIYDIANYAAYNKVKEGVDCMNTLFEHKQLLLPDDKPSLIDQCKQLAFTESAIGSINTGHSDPFVRVKGHHFDLVHSFRYCIASMYRYWGLPEIHYTYEDIDYSNQNTRSTDENSDDN